MNIIKVTNSPKQTKSISLYLDGQATIYLEYSIDNLCWYLSIAQGDKVSHSLRMAANTDLLAGLHHKFKTPIYALSYTGNDPLMLNDFVDGSLDLVTPTNDEEYNLLAELF
jgi:hypothetical protein